VEFDAVATEPASAAGRESGRFGDLVEPEHARVERAGPILCRAGRLAGRDGSRAVPPRSAIVSMSRYQGHRCDTGPCHGEVPAQAECLCRAGRLCRAECLCRAGRPRRRSAYAGGAPVQAGYPHGRGARRGGVPVEAGCPSRRVARTGGAPAQMGPYRPCRLP
jgi:hypothetical protein